MRTLLTSRVAGLMLLLAASVACGGSTPSAPAGPTPLPAPITMSARCVNPVHPGETASTACFVSVEGGVSRPVSAAADLRSFGGSAEARLVPCPACGAIEFDMEVRVPADMAPGPQAIAVWAIDANGRRGDATAVLQVAAR